MNKPVVIIPSGQATAALAEGTELLSLNVNLDASSGCTHTPAFLFMKYSSLLKVTCLGL